VKRRAVLAGVGTASIAATTGCSGILGGGGTGSGPCSVPSDTDLKEMLPEAGTGFDRTEAQTQRVPEGYPGQVRAFARYRKGEGTVLAAVTKYANESTAERIQEEESGPATTAYVQTGEYVFVASTESKQYEDRLEEVLGRSVLGEDCVRSRANTLES
jgi:hypothetical protein